MKYKLGLIDPPWEYSDKQGNDPARGGITYPVMTMKDLHELPLGNAFDDNSAIVVWVTFPKLVDLDKGLYSPLGMIRQWGFKPVTALFVWIKTNKTAIIPDDDDLEGFNGLYSGLGRYTNSNAEVAILARKGKGLERLDKSVKQVILSPIRGHSEKPREQYDRLHRLFGDVPRVELFARSQNPPPQGWDATGFDYNAESIQDWIERVNHASS